MRTKVDGSHSREEAGHAHRRPGPRAARGDQADLRDRAPLPCNHRNSDRLAARVVAHGELTSARPGVSAACRRVAGTESAAAIVTGWSRPYVSCVRPVGTSPTGEPAPDAAESHPAWVRAGDPPVPPG